MFGYSIKRSPFYRAPGPLRCDGCGETHPDYLMHNLPISGDAERWAMVCDGCAAAAYDAGPVDICKTPQDEREIIAVVASDMTGGSLTADASRFALIGWLCAADPNGTYRDDETICEFDSVTPIDDLWALVRCICDAD